MFIRLVYQPSVSRGSGIEIGGKESRTPGYVGNREVSACLSVCLSSDCLLRNSSHTMGPIVAKTETQAN